MIPNFNNTFFAKEMGGKKKVPTTWNSEANNFYMRRLGETTISHWDVHGT